MLGDLGEQRQGGEADQEPVWRRAGAQPEHRRERARAAAPAAARAVQHGRAELMQPAVGEFHLRLDAHGPRDRQPASLLGDDGRAVRSCRRRPRRAGRRLDCDRRARRSTAGRALHTRHDVPGASPGGLLPAKLLGRRSYTSFCRLPRRSGGQGATRGSPGAMQVVNREGWQDTIEEVDSKVTCELQLAGQTVLAIGGSAGIGLETARRASEQGADVIITARDPERLHRAGLELGASIAAFDATDFDRLESSSTICPDRSTTCWSRVPALLRASGGLRLRKGTPRRRRSSPAAAAGRSERRGQGSPGRDPVVHGRHRRPPHGTRPLSHLGAHRRASRHDKEPRARAGAGPREPDRGRDSSIRRCRRRSSVISWTRVASSSARRCRSAASSARPTSPHWPSTS